MSEHNQLSVELTGTVIAVEEPKEYGAKHFRKAQIAIEVTDGKFPQKLNKFEIECDFARPEYKNVNEFTV
jgi:hypothetical protein